MRTTSSFVVCLVLSLSEFGISLCFMCPPCSLNPKSFSRITAFQGLTGFCFLLGLTRHICTACIHVFFSSNGILLTSDPRYSPYEYFHFIIIYQAANICVSHLSVSADFIFPCRTSVKMLSSMEYTSKPCRKPL